MEIWQIFTIISMIFILIEIFVPVCFFVNFALGCLITAGVSLYVNNIEILIILAVVLSALFLVFVRPLLLKQKNNQTGIQDKYIGQIVKVIEPISKSGGAITIYGERWRAKNINSEEEIPQGADVKIIKNESLVFYVERV